MATTLPKPAAGKSPTWFSSKREDPSWGSEVCGMVPELARTVLAAVKDKDQDEFERIAANIRSSLPTHKVGVTIGVAMRDLYRSLSEEDQVVVCLISDPAEVDSKWMTFVSSEVESEAVAILAATYKYDAS